MKCYLSKILFSAIISIAIVGNVRVNAGDPGATCYSPFFSAVEEGEIISGLFPFSSVLFAQPTYDGGHGIILPGFDPIEKWEWHDKGPSVGSNDPVIFVEPEREYTYRMYVHHDGGQDLYRSKNAADWELVEKNVIPSGGGTNFNWGRKGPNGNYYLYRTVEDEYTELWWGETLTELENKGKVLDEPDAGGYYDPEEQKWHMYYEGIPGKGSPCSVTIDHAVSDDGIHWEKKGIALDVRDQDWKTGDPDVVRIGDTYHMFADRTAPDHTSYKIAVATSKNLNKFELREEPITDFYGGDACVRYVPEQNRFVMYVEFYGENHSGIGWGVSQRVSD